jgi:hypothetical protein
MSKEISQTMEQMVERMRQKHGVEPRLAYEWEFQLLDSKGKPVKEEVVTKFIESHPGVNRIYEERGHGLLEITTNPELPHVAADNMRDMQTKMGNWASEQGYHLNANPAVSGQEGSISGSAGMHVNASLVPVGTGELTGSSSVLSLHGGGGKIDGRTANVAESIVKINRETPLWSHHTQDDFIRLRHGDGTPASYNIGIDKTGRPGTVEIRRNNIVPRKPADMGRDPFGGEELMAARTEERIANARIDPHVAAFRTTLGQYHGLEEPIHEASAVINPKYISHGDIPKSLEAMAENHMQDGSIVKKYVGDLYDEKFLEHVDQQGRNPHLVANKLESAQFQIKRSPAAVKPEVPPATVGAADVSNIIPPAISAPPAIEPVITPQPQQAIPTPAISVAPSATPAVETIVTPPPEPARMGPITEAEHWEEKLTSQQRAQARIHAKGRSPADFTPSAEQTEYLAFLEKQKAQAAAARKVETLVESAEKAVSPAMVTSVESTTAKTIQQVERSAASSAKFGTGGKILAGAAILAAAAGAAWLYVRSSRKPAEQAPAAPAIHPPESYSMPAAEYNNMGRSDGKTWGAYVQEQATRAPELGNHR